MKQHQKPVPQEPEVQSPSEALQQSASPHARTQNRPVALETPKDQYNRHLEAARSRSGTLSGNLGHRTQSPRAVVTNGTACLHEGCLSVKIVFETPVTQAWTCGALSRALALERLHTYRLRCSQGMEAGLVLGHDCQFQCLFIIRHSYLTVCVLTP